MLDEYRWNKVQEVPLDLLSMDIDRESFISKMNKVFYKKLDEDQLKNKIDKIISDQLFYLTGGVQRPFDISINIGGIKITKELPGCTVYEDPMQEGVWTCRCSANCAKPEGTDVGSFDKSGQCAPLINLCISSVSSVYSAKFPFPLTFNGTDKFVDELSYNVVEK
jgi:hypothetical protein